MKSVIGSSGFRGPLCPSDSAQWMGDVLRWFDARYPDAIGEWRSLKLWVAFFRYFSEPGAGGATDATYLTELQTRRPKDLRDDVDRFLRANDNVPGSDNPWRIDLRRRSVQRTGKGVRYSFGLAEFRIGQVLSADRQLAFSRDIQARVSNAASTLSPTPEELQDLRAFEAFLAQPASSAPPCPRRAPVPVPHFEDGDE